MKKATSDLKYNTNLRGPIVTAINPSPKARVHSREHQKILNGDPVEINPSIGYGYKIMTIDEWSSRWKRNDDFPDCLNCGSKNTKEHHFTQVTHKGVQLQIHMSSPNHGIAAKLIGSFKEKESFLLLSQLSACP